MPHVQNIQTLADLNVGDTFRFVDALDGMPLMAVAEQRDDATLVTHAVQQRYFSWPTACRKDSTVIATDA